MTGIPQFNFPLFEHAAETLRERGYDIISPAELDSEAVQKFALKSKDGAYEDGKVAGETWGEILARDVQVLADRCGGVIFLPDWHRSRGAKLEATAGLLCSGFTFFAYMSDDSLIPLSRLDVKNAVHQAL